VKNFDEAYHNAVDVEGVSPKLLPHLQALYEAVPKGSAGRPEVRTHLVALLEYLCSPEGRTDANCKAVDYFFCMTDWSWDALPHAYQEMFADMGGALHNAVTDPDIAEALQSTPELLLARAKGLS
jgi:hypothetical protein